MKSFILVILLIPAIFAEDFTLSETYTIGERVDIPTDGMLFRVSHMPCVHSRIQSPHVHHDFTEEEFKEALRTYLVITDSEWKNGYFRSNEPPSEAKIFDEKKLKYTFYLDSTYTGRLFLHESNEVVFLAKERSDTMNPQVKIDLFEPVSPYNSGQSLRD
ncbi:hypothetical protein [Pelagicoccus sp. SDUM812003]|uniref:hypothetical protein n=1 Tax=Pelagicoccus sp. SDUM812003 TaxID=3041267 RepID=UPI00280E5340|nr:hypothetical protein [Pelagicoccus sp. SDUM812003]MDQ8205767.1 hypothetical protein [Pelagicoccus sp. SDUM812003]